MKKRTQLKTKTQGETTFTKRNKAGGQFMAQKKKLKFKGVRNSGSSLAPRSKPEPVLF